jgi:zinc/manganese transport system ATP-binding protein
VSAAGGRSGVGEAAVGRSGVDSGAHKGAGGGAGSNALYPDAAVLVEDLSLVLGDTVLFEHVSFVVNQGETAMIIGPNGAGKTMLVRTMLNLLSPQAGTVTLLGRDSRNLGGARDRIGYMPQRLDFDRTFPITVFEIMLLRLEKSGFWLNRRAKRQPVLDALTRVHAENLIDRRIGRLSGGELQRVLLAYALLLDPDLLILDEPAAGVDVAGEDTFYELIHHIRTERDLTVVMVSHDLDVVFKYADQVLCLNRELLCQGVPGTVLQPEILEKTYGALAASYRHHHEHDHGPRGTERRS